MAVTRAIRRLLGVREMEEEQCRAALERALGDLRQKEAELAVARERERSGRWLVTASARTGELVDRVAGIEETRAARCRAEQLQPKIAQAEQTVASRRQEFLATRIARRQVESLIGRAEEGEAVEAGRRTQKEMDEWFLERSAGATDGRQGRT
jgi:Flagellar FliJ protein